MVIKVLIETIFEESPELKQIMTFLFYKLKEQNMGVSRYGVQKTLFKLKKELGEEHSLADSIPYYWYIHGPYSETLESDLQSLIRTPNVLEKNKSLFYLNERLYDQLAKNPEENFPLIFEFYPEVNDILEDLIKNRNRFYNLDKEVYLDYAPYPFMYPYKFKIFNPYKSNETFDPSVFEKMIPIYFECESKLPEDEYFADYGEIYSNFVGVIDRLVTKDIIEDNFPLVRTNSINIWSTFAQGLGYKFHDSFYTYKLQIWQLKYTEQMHGLNDSLKKFRAIPRECKSNHEQKSNDFIFRTVEAYLQG